MIPLTQMLSERHNSHAIQFWLAKRLSAVARIPNEIVLDDSAALISAVCRVFGKATSTSAYIENSFQYIEGREWAKPSCLLRIDVADLTNLICKWPEISKLKRRTKEFFVKVIILIAKATSTEEIKALLTGIFIVSLSETEGISASTQRLTPCEASKKELLAKIACYTFPDNLDHTKHIDEVDAYAKCTAEYMFDEDIDARLSTLREWIDNIEKKKFQEMCLRQ